MATCTKELLKLMEILKFHEETDPVLDISNNYINHLAENRYGTPKYLAAASTDFSVQVYSKETFAKLKSFKAHSDTIQGLKFSCTNADLLWTCSEDGYIKLWDLRTENLKPIQELKDSSDDSLKPFLSFDINSDDSVLCAGTALIREDAFLVFWDCRSYNILGGYWETHTDDITEVKFHPSNKNLLTSGSTDGLINIFDIQEKTETDALQATFNSESSVDRLNWHLLKDGREIISCFTHMEELQLWDAKECNIINRYSREDFQNVLQDNNIVDYLVDTFTPQDEEIVILVGNNNGQGNVFRCHDKVPVHIARIQDSHEAVIRCIAWNNQDKMLITGGEDGKVCIWKTDSQANNGICETSLPSQTKMLSDLKAKIKIHNKKPYEM